MVCYVVPTTAAIVHFVARKKLPSFKTKYHLWLSHLLIGGALFGIIDHWWNGELFRGENLMWDLALGFTITIVIFLVWGTLVLADRFASPHTAKS
jgi:hypothetical protein